MARELVIRCDWCEKAFDGAAILDEDVITENYYQSGWVSVRIGPDDEDVQDFCSDECLVSSYTKEG